MSGRRTVTRGLLHLSVGEHEEAGPACGAAKDRACWTFTPADVTCADCIAMAREKRLPMSQADAIKAAVVAANNRAADAFLDWYRRAQPKPLPTDFADAIRSGAVAPGAVKP